MARLEIRLLGELRVLRDGREERLPASKKTRALLGYLVATGRPHLRERLCELLWEGPGDPRAELRWSLTKLRPLLNERAAERLRAERDRVAFDARGAGIDLAQARELLGPDAAHAPLDALRGAVRLLDGVFLDGLELPACPRFYEWCMGEREAAAALRSAALRQLVARLAHDPEQALGYARQSVAADPLSEPGHAAVVRLLGALGRVRDALAHYHYSRRLLEAELAAPLSGELDEAAAVLRRQGPAAHERPAARDAVAADAAPARAERPALVGRRAELARLDERVARAAAGREAGMVLLAGEPGIGKSRLLAHVAERVAAAGGLVLAARAFEAEVARPYGLWVDALGALPPEEFPPALRRDLAILLPALGPKRAERGDRGRLFEAIVELLRGAAARRGIAALLLDDLQWADDASCALLHYAVRALQKDSSLLVACAGRQDELRESAAARNLLQSLARERQLEEIQVGPLSAQETVELVAAIAPGVDGAAVFSESEGNPLFALELAQAKARGIDWAEHSLGSLIGAQLARLDARALDVATCAAAFGAAFTLRQLAPACGLEGAALPGALGELERRGLVRAVGEERYDFVHDLVRQAAYRSVSQPRRRLLHAQIARSLALAAEADPALYPDLARHASSAGEHELAARACAAAGERCLRAFANVEAATMAEMGLRHLYRLAPSRERLRLHIALLEVKLLARSVPGARAPEPQLAGELAEAVVQAERAGLHAEAATGFHLLATWHQEAGEPAKAHESSLRGAAAARAADETGRARHLARTARCLLDLEHDVERARALMREAAAAAERAGLELHELVFAEGLLQRWDGAGDQAAQSLERALAMTRHAQDRWSEYRCLTYLMMLEFERGQRERVAQHAERLLAVGADMGESDVPFARVLRALAGLRGDPDAAYRQLDAALAALREASDKSLLAYALNEAALQSLELGRPELAREFSAEALTAAQAMSRDSEALIAQAVLATSARARGGGEIGRVHTGVDDRAAISARARGALARAAAIPTPAPTPPRLC